MYARTQELKADRWVDYFSAIASSDDAPMVAVEVIRKRPGDQLNGAPRRLQSIGYDPEDGVLQITVGGRGAGDDVAVRHFISDPRRINIDESGPLQPTAILVEDASGIRTRIRLFDPLAPGPAPSGPRGSPGCAARGAPPRRRLRSLTEQASGSCG
jgi:hypothetical protein